MNQRQAEGSPQTGRAGITPPQPGVVRADWRIWRYSTKLIRRLAISPIGLALGPSSAEVRS